MNRSQAILKSVTVLSAIVSTFWSSNAFAAAVPGRISVNGTQFQVCGQRIWMNGVNTPWDNWNDFGGTYDANFWSTHYQTLNTNGINSSRVWITCSGEVGINISGAGNVSGATAAHWANLDNFFATAQSRGVYVMATLMSFDHFKNTYTTYQSWRNWINSDANIDSYINNYLIPFLARYGNNPALWSIDMCNEPDWATTTEPSAENGTIRWARFQQFWAKASNAIHANSPVLVTVGIGVPKYNSDAAGMSGNRVSDVNLRAAVNLADESKVKLDFWSPHYYGWMDGSFGIPFYESPASYGYTTDRPSMIGECPAPGSTGHTIAQDLDAAFANGWQGIMPWTSNAVDSLGAVNMTSMNNFRNAHAALVFPTCSTNPTNTSTRTNTLVPPTATRTSTPVPPTATRTSTPTVTRTNTSAPPTNTSTLTLTRTNTPIPATSTFTATRTATPVPPTSTATSTLSATPTASATRTSTAVPPTNTSTQTRTSTSSSTNTAIPATSTSTSVPPTSTATSTLTASRTSTSSSTSTFPPATLTPTRTMTLTVTNTLQFTATSTSSRTVTSSSTLTSTQTVTSTRTSSATSSQTATLTATRTSTESVTSTRTATPSATVTPTITNTLQFTATWTDTLTVTSTLTSSFTRTATPSATLTSTPTSTSSQTPTRTSTETSTPTASATPSRTVTPTATNTLQFTPTSTETSTLTSSATASLTRTATSSTTLTSTLTATSSRTSTVTSTESSTPTRTVTPTFTNTLQFTPTQTSTATRTASPTPTPTSTSTLTPTSSRTPTASATLSVTPTTTLTITLSPTQSATATETVEAGSEPIVFPNPSDGDPVKILPQHYKGTSDITVRIITVAFKTVAEKTYQNVPSGDTVTIDMTDKWGQPLASGLYYVEVTTKKNTAVGKLMIFR